MRESRKAQVGLRRWENRAGGRAKSDVEVCLSSERKRKPPNWSGTEAKSGIECGWIVNGQERKESAATCRS